MATNSKPEKKTPAKKAAAKKAPAKKAAPKKVAAKKAPANKSVPAGASKSTSNFDALTKSWTSDKASPSAGKSNTAAAKTSWIKRIFKKK